MSSNDYKRNPIFTQKPLAYPPRRYAGIGFVICFSALISAYWMEWYMGAEPCPLCILQRGVLYGLILFFLIQSIPKILPKNTTRGLSTIIGLLSAIGIAIAGRQVWLEHQPFGQVPSCAASLSRMLEMYPLLEALKQVLMSSGECGEVRFRILGLSLAEWSLVLFQVCFLLSLLQWKKADKS